MASTASACIHVNHSCRFRLLLLYDLADVFMTNCELTTSGASLQIDGRRPLSEFRLRSLKFGAVTWPYFAVCDGDLFELTSPVIQENQIGQELLVDVIDRCVL